MSAENFEGFVSFVRSQSSRLNQSAHGNFCSSQVTVS